MSNVDLGQWQHFKFTRWLSTDLPQRCQFFSDYFYHFLGKPFCLPSCRFMQVINLCFDNTIFNDNDDDDIDDDDKDNGDVYDDSVRFFFFPFNCEIKRNNRICDLWIWIKWILECREIGFFFTNFFSNFEEFTFSTKDSHQSFSSFILLGFSHFFLSIFPLNINSILFISDS